MLNTHESIMVHTTFAGMCHNVRRLRLMECHAALTLLYICWAWCLKLSLVSSHMPRYWKGVVVMVRGISADEVDDGAVDWLVDGVDGGSA